MEKLDGSLRILSHRFEASKTKTRSLGIAPEPGLTPDVLVDLFVEFEGEIREIESAGLITSAVFGNIATGRAPLEAIERIAALAQVRRMSKSQPNRLSLDESTRDVRADTVRSINASNVWSGNTGAGVIIAVLDTGINYQHLSFRKPDGTSRILKIWDQELTAITGQPGSQPSQTIVNGSWTANINYGVVYTQTEITAALQPGGAAIRHEDTHGHGTHVAGIAAGNGIQRDHCGRFYPGVAPNADLIVVKIKNLDDGSASSTDVLNGIAFAVNEANNLPGTPSKKPLAINMSLGHSAGPHDGSTPYERCVNYILQNHPAGSKSIAIVISAGNSANDSQHAQASVVTATPLELQFQFLNSGTPKAIDLWYPGASTLNCVLVTHAATSANIAPDTPPVTVNIGGGTVVVTSATDPANTDKNIYIELNPPSNGFSGASSRWITWTLRLINPNPAPVQFHAWAANADFKNHISQSSTVNVPGTSSEAVTVGSYSLSGPLSEFSSRGPTRDNRIKPEISAPGEEITAAGQGTPGCCEHFWCSCCNVYHVDKNGTSMAAPHVAGAIALMMELNPDLTHAQIRSIIANTANSRQDSHTGAVGSLPSNLWGSGKLDVARLRDAAAATVAPAGSIRSAGGSEMEAIASPLADPFKFSEDLWQELGNRFMDTPGGKKLYAIALQYFPEMQSLINENKRAATIWHRNDGPLLLRLALRYVMTPDEPTPREINGISLRSRLENLARMFSRYVSQPLQELIDQKGPLLLALEGYSVNQMIEYFNHTQDW